MQDSWEKSVGLQRRTLLGATGALLAAGASGWTGMAQASEWPSRPVNLIVPFPAGGGTDTFARPFSAQFAKTSGKTLVIDNRGGAGGTLGASIAAKAAPDGYNFFMGGTHHVIAPSVYPKLEYDLERDFIPLALLASVPQVVVVNPKKVTHASLQALVQDLRANPGKYNYASAGPGSSHHLAGELFKQQTGTFITHIPYRGSGPAQADFLGGQVPLMVDSVTAALANIQAGKAIPLGVTSSTRSSQLPEVPTIAESGLPEFRGFEAVGWLGLMAPKGTPKDIVERLNRETVAILRSPEMRKFISDRGSEAVPTTPAEMDAFVATEITQWGQAVRQSGASVD